jgi:hypothetical protein
MRWFFLLISGTVLALPQTIPNSPSSPHTGWAGFLTTLDFKNAFSNDLNGPCKDIFVIVARGSMEPGNIGVTTGPRLCDALKKGYPERVGCQGIDPTGYTAGLGDNMLPKGTADASIHAGVKAFTDANQQCPDSHLVFTGYR